MDPPKGLLLCQFFVPAKSSQCDDHNIWKLSAYHQWTSLLLFMSTKRDHHVDLMCFHASDERLRTNGCACPSTTVSPSRDLQLLSRDLHLCLTSKVALPAGLTPQDVFACNFDWTQTLAWFRRVHVASKPATLVSCKRIRESGWKAGLLCFCSPEVGLWESWR